MDVFRINFELKANLDEIVPFGEKGGYSLSWFGLTDGLLWITAGDKTVYEYSDAALREWAALDTTIITFRGFWRIFRIFSRK